MITKYEEELNQVHSEDMQDIISAPPAWLLRWGITVFLGVLVLLIALSVFIRYPDTVKTTLKINSLNSPKPIITKTQGKLVKLLVADGGTVKNNQPLAYIESTANHKQVLTLLAECKRIEKDIFSSLFTGSALLTTPEHLQLGEIQSSYHSFYQSYLTYRASVNNGFYLKQRIFLESGLAHLSNQKKQLLARKDIQQRDFELSDEEYNVHKLLADKKVETTMELKQQESKLLAKRAPLIQTEESLITLDNNYLSKRKEIAELDNQIAEEKDKFIQALNSLISDMEMWKTRYILTASQAGTVTFAGILQQNQILNINEQVFYINSGDERFFGEISIPQYNMGKIEVGQQVLVKLKSYPYEEYGMVTGRLSSISEVPVRDSVFVSKVSFGKDGFSRLKKGVKLKYGMLADAEIITEDASLFKRLSRNIIKIIY